MALQTINDSLTLTIPDPFSVMEAEELHQLSRHGGDPFRWGARDRERHVILAAVWKQYPAPLLFLAGLKSMARRNLELVRKACPGRELRSVEFLSIHAGEFPAEGYRFTYSEGDMPQTQTTFLLKKGRVVYGLLCFGREENRAADQSMFLGVMDSLRTAD